MFDFCMSIADKKIKIKCDSELLDYQADEAKEFKEHVCESVSADLDFNIKYGKVPEFQDKKVLFSVDDSWALCKWEGNFLLEYVDRVLPGRTERAGVINEDFTKGTIYINYEKTEEEKELSRKIQESRDDERSKERKRKRELNVKSSRPVTKRIKKKKTTLELGNSVMGEFKANFFQAFLVEYVVRKRLGFMAHCATVEKNGNTYIFMGQSGAGKSTIAEMLLDNCDATVYNDDRAVLNVEDGNVCFYNLPWTGTLTNKCSKGKGDGSKLCGIFFISHAKENIIRKVSKIEGITKIFKNSFPVFWNKKDIDYIFSICEKIAAKVPCYELGFVNDKSVVDFLADNKYVNF